MPLLLKKGGLAAESLLNKKWLTIKTKTIKNKILKLSIIIISLTFYIIQ